MSSRGKKKTTMAKLNREARLRDRRNEKQARKEARREAAAAAPVRDLTAMDDLDGGLLPTGGRPDRDAVARLGLDHPEVPTIHRRG